MIDQPRFMSDAVIVTGFLGWSNMRDGTEIYSQEHDRNGRWVSRRRGGSEAHRWGDLLVDELADHGVSEGAALVVVALPRFSSVDRQTVIDAIAKAVSDD